MLEPDEQLTVPVLQQSDEEDIARNGLLERFAVAVNGRITIPFQET